MNFNNTLSGTTDYFQAQMGSREFNRLSEYITREFGIKLPPIKKVMLQSRLQKRLKELQFVDFKQYLDYLFSEKGMKEEVIHMMDMVSTNKTDFFREPVHFEVLSSLVLPELYNSGQPVVKIWSAGCSSGEEPYTLGIVLNEFTRRCHGMDYSIYATDISSRMLKTATAAIYNEERIKEIPMEIKKRYFLRSKNREEKKVKVVSEITAKVIFERLNLNHDQYRVPEAYDIIFCRNVLIYFDRDTQESIINRLCSKLKPHGYLFLGHSESITGFDVPLKHIRPTIFRKI